MKALAYHIGKLRFLSLKRDVDRQLVNVCAWCPKDGYPMLKAWQEYTHGICRRHYKEVRIRQNQTLLSAVEDAVLDLYDIFSHLPRLTSRFLTQ